MNRILYAFSLCLFLTSSLLFAGESEGTAQIQDLGFWEIGISDVEAGNPIVVLAPGDDSRQFIVLPFTFKNVVSLQRVLPYLESLLANAEEEDEALRALLVRLIEKLKKDLELGPGLAQLKIMERQLSAIKERAEGTEAFLATVGRTLDYIRAEMAEEGSGVKISAKIITDSGEVYPDISNTIIRDVAERALISQKVFAEKGGNVGPFLTTLELARVKASPDQQLFCVAVFPAINPASDRFEIQVAGLGRRIMPSYYPGYLLKLGPRPEAKLKKVLRLFYERPGDERNRSMDAIHPVSLRSEWIWLWSNEIFPMQPKSFELERSLDEKSGKPLNFSFRYFSYEVFNSTPDPKMIQVIKAGLAPRIRWHGMDMVVPMIEGKTDDDFRSKQAIREIAKMEGEGFLPEEVRILNTVVQPGKLAKGTAVVEWGVTDAEALFSEFSAYIAVVGLTSRDEPNPDPMLAEYVKLWREEGQTSALLARKPMPTKAETRAFVLKWVNQELGESGVSVTEADTRRYGELAPFAVLINLLADREMKDLAEEGRLATFFEVKLNDFPDAARIVTLTELGRPVERTIAAGHATAEELSAGSSTGAKSEEGEESATDSGEKKPEESTTPEGEKEKEGASDVW